MGKMLFVDLGEGSIRTETTDRELEQKFLGGYGIGARVLLIEQEAGVDPLGQHNTIGFISLKCKKAVLERPIYIKAAPIPGRTFFTIPL